MSKTRTAPSAEAGTTAPATPSKPTSLLTPPRERDEMTGKGGTYVRDPATGKRTLQAPEPTTPAPTSDQA